MIVEINACLSKKSDNWRTPKKLYDFMINDLKCVDLAPYQENVIRDTLIEEWNYRRIFLNPPYSKNKEFINKAIETIEKYNNEIYLLIPSRTDTKYFSALFHHFEYIVFIKGRLHFNDSKDSAPFPSMFVKLSKVTYHRIYNYDISQLLCFLDLNKKGGE